MLSQTFNFTESDISDFDDILSSSSGDNHPDQTLSSLGHHSDILDSNQNNSGIATDETLSSGKRYIVLNTNQHDDPFETGHTRQFYRGTSFRFAGKWQEGVHYIHDEYIVDFVVKGSVLLVCTQSHMSDSENEPTDFVKEGQTITGIDSPYWDLVLTGGIRGKAYLPRYDIDTDSLIWTLLDPEHLPDEFSTYLGLKGFVSYLVSPVTDQLRDLNDEMTKLDRDVSDMEVITSHISSEMSDLNQNYSHFEQTVNGFILEVRSFSGEIGELWLTARDFGVRMSNAEGDIASFQMTANEIQTRVENIDGDISQIHQTADEIRTQVENNSGDISRISQKATEIESEVENAKGDISRVSQKADIIESEVLNAQGDISVITQKANQIESRVENNEGDISRVSQKADRIESTVENNSGDISQIIQRADVIEQTVRANKAEADGAFIEMESKITQTAQEITSEVHQTVSSLDNAITSMESKITQQAGLIETKVSQTDYDYRLGQVEQNASRIEQKADNINLSVERVDGKIDDTAQAFNDYVTTTNGLLEIIQNQLDGAVDVYYLNGVPSLSVPPVINPPGGTYNDPWLDGTETPAQVIAIYKEHIGDLYYDLDSGYCYRFLENEGVYSWEIVSDAVLTEALNKAREAKTVADGKMKVFVNTPVPPYQEGDLWVQGAISSGGNAGNGLIYVCVREKTTGQAFDSSDWAVAFDAVTIKKAKSAFDVFADAIEGRVWQEDPSGLISSNTYSSVKQTVDTINLHIENTKSALRATGIDITGVQFDEYGVPINGGTVVITADNFKIQANNSQVQDPISITIVDGHPKINVSSLDVAGIFRTQAYSDANQAALNQFYTDNIASIASGVSGLNYLKQATNNGTLISNGLVLTSSILLGATVSSSYQIMSGITGVADTSAYGNGIAGWYGGAGLDRYYGANTDANNAARTLFRHDGSGYLAKQNIKWEADGSGYLAGDNISWDAAGRLTVKGGILSTELELGYNLYDRWNIMAGISGRYDFDGTVPGHGIAAWFGGEKKDLAIDANSSDPNAAKSLFRFDGSGYLASRAISWGAAGDLHIGDNVYFGQGTDQQVSDLTPVFAAAMKFNSWFKDEDVLINGQHRRILRINTNGTADSGTDFVGVVFDGLLLTSGDHIVGDTLNWGGPTPGQNTVKHVIMSQQEWEALPNPEPAVIYMIYES